MKFNDMPYERVDFEAAGAELDEVSRNIAAASSAAEVMELYSRAESLMLRAETMSSLVYVRHTINTTDAFYDAEHSYYDENEPVFEASTSRFYGAMTKSAFRPELEKALGELWFVNADMLLRGFDEKLIPEMQKENAILSEYKKLLASCSLLFDGKKCNLPLLRAYQLSPDRSVRKAAYAKRTEFFMANAESFDRYYDELVHLRDSMAKKLGMSSFTELGYIRMKRNSYTESDVAEFRKQVKRVLVPFISELQKEREAMLGVDKLRFYDDDVFFAEGNPAPEGTPDEMFAAGKTMYSELSGETREFFAYMLDNGLFDVLAKEGKSGGGYSTSFPLFGAPFVFANFNGTSEDVDTLTHECGHALNTYLARELPVVEYREPTLDVAEIHSMSMEFFTANWMHLFFGKNTKKYLYLHLMTSLIFIPYGCLVDEFQHEVYAHPDLSPDGRKELWLRLEKEYRPETDYDGDPFFGKGGLWQRQSHIYEVPFYYIDYCLAETCALQYRVWMHRDMPKAWDSYISLSKKGGSERFSDLVAEAGLCSPFKEGCFEPIIEGCRAILAELKSGM